MGSKKGDSVDRSALEKAIARAEVSGPLSSRNKLWQAAAELYNKGAEHHITSTVVYLRVKEWGLACKTPAGASVGRGELSAEQRQAMAAGRARAAATPRKSREDKLKGHSDFARHAEALRNVTPRTFKTLVEKALKGSTPARIKLHCLQCMGYSRKDVGGCTSPGCEWWLARPYQRDDEDDDVAD